ncbi:MAG: T9SS type A sorting domain-containing protein [Candidatus Krumholzibacteriota bacterium]|nr:T9SS type A sorting domain-containing protein [Candidatus Krumholzibacteriota bacterium]
MKGQKLLSTICLIVLLGASTSRAQQSAYYTVSWDQSPDPSVVEILVYRSLTTDLADFAFIGSVPVSETEYTDNSVAHNIRYYYRLKAENNTGGLSQFSAMVSGLTLNEISPQYLQDLCCITSVEEVTGESYRIEWSTESSTTGRLRYWRTEDPTIRETDLIEQASVSHAVVLDNLDTDDTYFVRAVAYDAAGGMTISCIATFSTGDQQPADLYIVASSERVVVPEGSSAQFSIRLSEQPADNVSLALGLYSGDLDISLQSGNTLDFTTGNWNIGQTVTLAAADDVDDENGEAVIVIASISGPEMPNRYVTAVEDDDDFGGDPHNGNLAAGPVAIYPVPFKPDIGVLTINNLPSSGSLGIYDLKGQIVWNRSWSGQTNLVWDGTNNNHSEISSGRYFVVIKDGSGAIVDKRVVLAVR